MRGLRGGFAAASLLMGALLPVDAEQVLVFGDSLSKEYAIEWIADFFPDEVMSWTEILDQERNSRFDYGSESVFNDQRYWGHEYNWSIPGAKIDDFVQIVRGNTEETIPFFGRTEAEIIEDQLSDVERFVLFVGGNDAEDWYDNAYAGEDLTTEFEAFVADTAEVLDWVLAEGPGSLQAVLVGVPHVGITPKIKSDFPPGPGTDLATAAYATLNAQLEALAASRGVGFMDIFKLNLGLLDATTLCYQGKSFVNHASDSGNIHYAWLGGNATDFHPNTIAQAVIANEILRVFNAFYGSEIRWLTTEEIVDDLMGREPDVSFEQWLTCYGLAGGLATDDPDADGVDLLTEFGLGMDPRVEDRWRYPEVSTGPDGMGGWELRLTYRPRLDRASSVVEVVPQFSMGGLTGWTDAAMEWVSKNPDGSVTARYPVIEESLFERVRVGLLP